MELIKAICRALRCRQCGREVAGVVCEYCDVG
jgi:hypothetical protein